MMSNGVPEEDQRHKIESMMAEAKDALAAFCDLVAVGMAGEVEYETVREGFNALSLLMGCLGALLAVAIAGGQ